MKLYHRLFALLLCCALLMGSLPAFAAASPREDALRFLLQQAREPSAGDTYGDWEIFALARSGGAVADGYYAAWLKRVDRVLAENGGKLTGPVTGNLRLMLSLLALDRDLTDVGGYDLTAIVKDSQRVCRTAVMGPAFGILILKNTGGDPAAEQAYLQHLLDKQLADGGWALSGQIADPDATAMTLQALSLCRKEAGVEAAIGRGLARLSAMQLETGGFTAWGTTGCESVAQTIIALNMLNIPLTDSRFVKNGNSLLDAMLAYQLADGSFSHTPDGAYDIMATQQALLALESLRRADARKPGIYILTDRVQVREGFVGLPGKDKRISVPGKTANIPTFTDIHGLAEADAILALAHRGIVNGVGNGRFDPSAHFTRAQFCAMAQRALTLPTAPGQHFSDVPAGQWYTDSVNAAFAFGAVQGVGNGKFDPNRVITRQEAAVLVSRLAAVCGRNTQMNDLAVRNVLSAFGDYRACADWATQGLAFCYANGILDDSALNIDPAAPVTRAEAAAMFYALLDGALLLED